MSKLVVERLSARHDRAGFSCGNVVLDDYLKTCAGQHDRKGVSKTWVACFAEESLIAGYVTLSAGHIAFSDLDVEHVQKLPRHPLPVIHVGRLATHLDFQGRGIASMLLRHAVEVAIEASASFGVYALELEAIDQAAYDYYIRRGFLPLNPGEQARLFAPLATLVESLKP